MADMRLSDAKVLNSIEEAVSNNAFLAAFGDGKNFKLPVQVIGGSGNQAGCENCCNCDNGNQGGSGIGNTKYEVIDIGCALYDADGVLVPFSTGAAGVDKFGNAGTYLGTDQNSGYIGYDYASVIGMDTNIGFITVDITDKPQNSSHSWLAFTNTPINLVKPIDSLKAAFFISAVHFPDNGNGVSLCFSSTNEYKSGQNLNLTFTQGVVVIISGGAIGVQSVNASGPGY